MIFVYLIHFIQLRLRFTLIDRSCESITTYLKFVKLRDNMQIVNFVKYFGLRIFSSCNVDLHGNKLTIPEYVN